MKNCFYIKWVQFLLWLPTTEPWDQTLGTSYEILSECSGIEAFVSTLGARGVLTK